ncbi:MAG: alpha/beta hydrolase [Phycisphaerales bacterium]|nr:alpha/beta hydrolase [Phycisphaerales bacterium]
MNGMPTTTNPAPARVVPVRTAEVRGAAIDAKVIDVGSGTPVVFLHGLVGLNEHWEEVVSRIQGQVRCVMVELPLLDLPTEVCSINGVANLTQRLIRDYLDAPAVLVGNSFGGHVALRVALEQPDIVHGLVLAGSSGLIEKSIVRDVQIRPSREWLNEKIGELFHDRAFMREADLDRAHRELSQRAKARAMVRLSRTARRNHLGRQMSEIRTPTLLIWGRQDVVTPPEAAEQFHELIPNSRLVWFDQCGHVPMVERADEFAAELLQFVGELSTTPERS